jgi:outer membrane protein TolC
MRPALVRFAALAVAAVSLLLLLIPADARAGRRTFRDGVVDIGVVVDGPWERNDLVADLVREEVLTLVGDEFQVRFPEEKMLTADWTEAGVRASLEQLLGDADVDIVLAMGSLASHLACTQPRLPKPVFAPFVLDMDLQQVPSEGVTSGVRNLSYLALPSTVAGELATFQEIAPHRHLAVLANGPFLGAIPTGFGERFRVLDDTGFAVQVIPVGFEIGPALEALEDEVDAVYVAPLLHLAPEEFDALVSGLIERGLPSFSMFGRSDVERGILAGLGQESHFPSLIRRLALHVQQYLLGEDPGDLPVTFTARERLSINLDTARAIGLSPRWDVLAEAERIHEKPGPEPRLSIKAAVLEALEANLDLSAGEAEVSAGEQEVVEARSLLLPGVDLGAMGLAIDKDRAEAGMGGASEFSGSGSATLTVPLFVEPALAGLAAQRDLQTGREQAQSQRESDVIYEAATTYLVVLRARTFEELQQDNLSVTRKNLDLARVRQRIGVAGPAEVYRWEVEVALARKASLEAFYDRRLAEVALNRVLHRPLDGSLYLQERRFGPTGLLTNEGRLLPYIDDPWSFTAFSDYLVEQGLDASPELAQFDEAISAQTRLHRSAQRGWYAPTVGLQASVTQWFYKGGAGSEPIDFGDLPIEFPQADDTDWQLGIQADFPLFSGGGRRARVLRTATELTQLERERAALAERLEQRMRSAMFAGLSSLQGVAHARDAADAAHANLDFVTSAYSVGSLSILELLDAQQAALRTDLLALDAEYAFQLDLVEVMRATNRFGFLETEAEREAWYQALDERFQALGLTPVETP